MFSFSKSNDEVIDNRKDAIDFLKQNQPVPDKLTLNFKKRYLEVIDFFENNPDHECVGLFINSLGKETTGIFDYVEDALGRQDRKVLISQLKKALQGSNSQTVENACILALAFDFVEVEDQIRPLLKHSNEDVVDQAKMYLYLLFDEESD